MFEAAVEMDYHRATRGATYEEIGAAVGLSGATAGERLPRVGANSSSLRCDYGSGMDDERAC